MDRKKNKGGFDMKKKVWIGICIGIVLVLMIVGYIVIQGLLHPMNQIYTNIDKMVSKENSYNLFMQEQSIIDTTYEANMELEGMGMIWTYQATSDETIDIRYLLKNSQGQAKLVLVKANGEVQTIVEAKENNNMDVTQMARVTLTKGENFIKVVAKDHAKIEVKLQAPKGNFKKLGF